MGLKHRQRRKSGEKIRTVRTCVCLPLLPCVDTVAPLDKKPLAFRTMYENRINAERSATARSKSRFANRIMQTGYILLFDDSDIGFIVHYYLAGSNRTICSHAKFRTNNTIVNMIGTNGRVRRQCRHVLSE